MGMFDEMKKREEADKGCFDGEIVFKFTENNDGIGANVSIEATRLMLIEATAILLQKCYELEIPTKLVTMRMAYLCLNKKGEDKND